MELKEVRWLRAPARVRGLIRFRTEGGQERDAFLLAVKEDGFSWTEQEGVPSRWTFWADCERAEVVSL